MLLVGYGIRHERRLCQKLVLHLAYRWFCKLDLDDKVPHHSTFSVNRLGRFFSDCSRSIGNLRDEHDPQSLVGSFSAIPVLGLLLIGRSRQHDAANVAPLTRAI